MADRALLIGINQYRSPDVPTLRGCVADTADVFALLKDTIRIDPASIRTLLNSGADGRHVRQQLAWLAADATPGDRRVLHVSSHGSFTADTDGDEDDGRDEIVCLYDLDWSDPRTYLLDDELGRWIATVPAGVHLTLLLDCCHSGTGTRELTPPSGTRSLAAHRAPRIDLAATAARARAAGDGVAPERQPYVSPHLVLARYAPPPAVIEAAAARAPRRRSATATVASQADAVLYAACRPDQTAADAYLGEGFRGAFSYHFCRILRASDGKIGRAELLAKLKSAMRAGRFSQEPQIEAATPRGRALGPLP